MGKKRHIHPMRPAFIIDVYKRQVQGADYYRIYRRIAGTKTDGWLEETEETGYTDTGVMPGTSYEYTVCGCHVGYQLSLIHI